MKTREEENTYARAWYAKHKDRVNAKRRAETDYSSDYQRRKPYMQKYYQEHTAEFTARERKRTPESKAAYGRAYRLKGLHMISRAKIRAKRNGWDFDLTKSWIEERLAAGVCEASGLPFTPRGEKGPCAPSIDRRDSSKGYTQANCRVILWALNAAFNEWGEEAFTAIFKTYLQRKDSRV